MTVKLSEMFLVLNDMVMLLSSRIGLGILGAFLFLGRESHCGVLGMDEVVTCLQLLLKSLLDYLSHLLDLIL